jgi:hypothetical protein
MAPGPQRRTPHPSTGLRADGEHSDIEVPTWRFDAKSLVPESSVQPGSGRRLTIPRRYSTRDQEARMRRILLVIGYALLMAIAVAAPALAGPGGCCP